MSENQKPVLQVLRGEKPDRVPFWLMRQAGRYLPEYRELRATAGGFLDLVYDPEKAAEVTVQPLRRFGMDAAILFSDILVVPDALGQRVTFAAGEGPRLEPLRCAADLSRLNPGSTAEKFSSVAETVFRTREKLRAENFSRTALIGFCGAPWTVACYMVQGSGSKDFEAVRKVAMTEPEFFQTLIDLVAEASCDYLERQAAAGAEVLKIFDSWAGLLDPEQFQRWVIAPTRKIRERLKTSFPDVPVIGFARGAGTMNVAYARETGIDGVNIDQTVPPDWAAQHLQPLMPVQGNLDPVRLLSGGAALERGLQDIETTLAEGPFIFNLGHGVIKETDIANVQKLTDIVRSWKL